MSNAKVIPIACLGAVIIKHPLIPVSQAGNRGQRLVLESILPLMGFRQWCLEGDSPGFDCNELRGVGYSYGPKEISRWLILDRNQDFGGRSLFKNKKGQKKNLRWNSRKVIPNEPEEGKIYLKSLVLVHHLKVEAWKIDELGFGSRRKLQRFEGGKNGCWTDSAWERWAFMVNSGLKSSFIP
jgi:hypothetical protein